MLKNCKKDLQLLQQAAQDREWNTIQPTLRRLLECLGFFPALTVVVDYLNSYFPTFHKYNPPDSQTGRLPRELLVGVVSYGFAPENLPDFLTTEYDSPGSGQFAHAVLELCRATQRERDPAERYPLMVSALANGVLAALSELWYSQHPEAYARVRDNRVDPETGEYTDPDAIRLIPMQFWIDPQVAARDTEIWLTIADAIERKLEETNE